jgi:hypothetical protein
MKARLQKVNGSNDYDSIIGTIGELSIGASNTISFAVNDEKKISTSFDLSKYHQQDSFIIFKNKSDIGFVFRKI